MQTITTKYYGPTNTKGARIMATNTSKSAKVWMHYCYGLNIQDNHRSAAMLLRDKLKWSGTWVGGTTNDGMVFVCTGSGIKF